MKDKFVELNEGQLVTFKLPDIDKKIYGIIRGKALVELPEIGATYIIEPLSDKLPNETYPYSFIALPQVLLTSLKKGFPKANEAIQKAKDNDLTESGKRLVKIIKKDPLL